MDCKILPCLWQNLEQGGILVAGFLGKRLSKHGSILFRSIWSWNNVMKARVEDNLHAPINLGACNHSGINLGSDAGMDASL